MKTLLVLILSVGTTTAATITDPRPVSQAMRDLESRYHQVITYEDPRYAFEGDVVDKTSATWAKDHPGEKAFVPKSRTLTIDTSLWPATAPKDPTVLPKMILAVNAKTGGPTFQLLQTPGALHVVPGAARNASGQWVTSKSILDVPLTLTKQRLSVAQALTEIAKAISAHGVEVYLGTFPLNLTFNHETDLEAAGESARTVLLRTLAATGAKLSWRLYYGADVGYYFLNIHIVELPPEVRGDAPAPTLNP